MEPTAFISVANFEAVFSAAVNESEGTDLKSAIGDDADDKDVTLPTLRDMFRYIGGVVSFIVMKNVVDLGL